MSLEPHPPPKLLDQVRDAIRVRHYSLRTEETYVGWIRQFILFHSKRHPSEMGQAEISQFLSHLAVKRQVTASTQNQALSALVFLYRHVLKQDLGTIDTFEQAKRPQRLPLVFSPGRSAGSTGTTGRHGVADGKPAVWGRACA